MEITSFEDFKLNKQLLTAIEEMGYQTPTPIQQKAIPAILAGQDIFGIAQTGTGKTAAFVLPTLMKIKYAQGMHPRALILAPTRELAMQITEQVKALAAHTDIRYLCIYGGIGPKTQIEEIQKGVDILIATPGRLMEVYSREALMLRDLKVLILDEADRMMDMGFMPQIRRLLEIIPSKRQNLLFSATLPDKVVKLSEEFLEFPVRIEVTPQASTRETTEQVVYHVPNFKTKINLLGLFLADDEVFKRVIVFAKTKAHAENIYKFLSRKVSTRVRVIHANKGQNTRINSMDDFKKGDIQILVATDVAARGIDVSMVSHVINFDVPHLYEDYVHRIGRTGRAENTGIAITFCLKSEVYHLEKIEKLIKMQIPVKPLPEGLTIEETPFEEEQDMLREIDNQRKKEDPDFKGAFHEKKFERKDVPAKRKNVTAKGNKKSDFRRKPKKSR